jgi:type 1 glutamine amidotransferase
LELLLNLTADGTPPELKAAATGALRRGQDAGINPALRKLAAGGGPRSIAAMEALAVRAAVDAVPELWALAENQDAGISGAAFKALGLLVIPGDLGALLGKLVAADGTPQAANLGALTWNVIRRHPDPAAAAGLLVTSAADAPAATRELLLRYATRICPKGAPMTTAIPVNLSANDDRRILAPNGYEEIAYLNCGTLGEARGGAGVIIRRTAGLTYQFGGGDSPHHSVDTGKEVRYEISGLDANSHYAVGFTTWDADLKMRRQAFAADDVALLPDFSPISYHADKPGCTRIHLPLPRAITADGKTVLTMACLSGPNAVISELWLLRRAATTTKRVLILTGDDHPAHLWRGTGPEFARILRADPRLEVTISESPALLGSPILSSYDAVFLHFKNYSNRVPTSAAMWKNLETYVNDGGGLVIGHFGCGALQEWNGFVKVAGRIWDPEKRGHDPFGEFLVRILQTGHPVTRSLRDFTTTDELYTCLTGDTGIEVLANATSKVDKSIQPMAFVLTPGKGRVFNSPLGHNLKALEAQGVRDLYLKGTLWAAGLEK